MADGYARNYLFPRKIAAPVNEATRRRLGKVQRDREANRKAELEKALAMVKRLEGVSCTITVKAGEGEKLYGSVSGQDIVDALKSQGVEIERHALMMEHPIKELGVFDVKVKLSADVEAVVKVWVVEE